MKFFPKFGLLLSLVLTTHLGISQSAVILINEKPTRVVLKNGDIAEVKNLVPRYMDGYKRSPKDDFIKLPFEFLNDNRAMASSTSDTPVIEEFIVSESVNNENYEEDITDSEDKAVYFDFDSAILTAEALEAIKSYSTEIKENKIQSILLKSWYKSGDSNSYELINNRLTACRQYLEANGVPSNLILTSTVGSNRESRFVSILIN